MYKVGDKFKVGTNTNGTTKVMVIIYDHTKFSGRYFCKTGCCLRSAHTKEELDKLEKIN